MHRRGLNTRNPGSLKTFDGNLITYKRERVSKEGQERRKKKKGRKGIREKDIARRAYCQR